MLYVLKNSKPKLRNAILKTADTDLISTIEEIVYNTLKGNNPIDNSTKTKLIKHKKAMRCFVCPKQTKTSKRKVLIQKGGFLPIIISALLSGIIGKLLENA